MCFYDEYKMSCGHYKWGNFRQHCNKEYRTGATCEMKLVMNTIIRSEKCKLCEKIDTKRARVDSERQRIERWKREGRDEAEFSRTHETIQVLEHHIATLEDMRSIHVRSLDGDITITGDMPVGTMPTAGASPHIPTLHTPFEAPEETNKQLIPGVSVSTQASSNITELRGDDKPTRRSYADKESDSIQGRNSSPSSHTNKFHDERDCKRDRDFSTQDPAKLQQSQETHLQAQKPLPNPIILVDKQLGYETATPSATEGANDTTSDYNEVSETDEISSISEASSVNSVTDSRFSLFTVSSASSIGIIPRTDERLYTLLTVNDFNDLYASIYNTSTPRKSEQNLRRLLKVFALCLKKEALSLPETRAANFVRYRARNLAYLIIAQLGKGKGRNSTSSFDVHRPEEQDISENEEQDEDDEDGDDEDGDDEDGEDEDGQDEDTTDVLSLETFILGSNAIKDFRTHLVFLVQTQCSGEQIADPSELSCGDVAAMANTDGLQLLETQWEKIREIRWKSGCGLSFQEQVTEFKPGAAEALALSLSPTNLSIDIEQLAGSQEISGSSSSQNASGPNDAHRRSSPSKFSTETSGLNKNLKAKIVEEDIEDKQYILLCRKYGTDMKLHHADISKAPCDHSSYHVLHKHYYGRFSKLWRWLSLKEISTIEFVRFHLYWSTNVSIDDTDFGVLPPMLSSEYSYNADTRPPVPRTALRHFIQHPDHAPKSPRHRPRIPKKVREQLSLHKDVDSREGYGLYIQERMNWVKFFVVEAVFATCCVLFAVGWCVRNEGGIQDGFAIAGTGIAYATIMLGALQAVSQSW